MRKIVGFIAMLFVLSFTLVSCNSMWKLDNDGTFEYIEYGNKKAIVGLVEEKDFEEITIPDDVTEIRKLNSSSNTNLNLKKINFSSSGKLEKIYSFGYFYSDEINIPEGVKYIGDNCFMSCKNLTKVTIHNSIEYIGSDLFAYNAKIVTNSESLYGDSNQYIGNSTNPYLCLYKLRNSSIKNGCKFILSDVIGEYYQIKNLSIPDSVVQICAGAMIRNLFGNLSIPSSVKYIGSNAISCNGLSKVTIPSTITGVSSGAFYFSETISKIDESINDKIYIKGGYKDYSLEVNKYDNGLYIGNNTDKYLYLICPYDFNNNTLNVSDSCIGMNIYDKGSSSSVYDYYRNKVLYLTLSSKLQDFDIFVLPKNSNLKLSESNGGYYIGSSDNKYLILHHVATEEKTFKVEEGCKVIFDNAFTANKALTEIEIASTVIKTGDRLFNDNVKKITIDMTFNDFVSNTKCDGWNITESGLSKADFVFNDGIYNGKYIEYLTY